MGVIFWQFPFSLDLPTRRDPESGDGRYVADMSIFPPRERPPR